MAIQLEGNTLLYTVTTLTCLGFLLIGFDNGLMGGFVNSPAFTGTFGIDTNTSSGTNTIALIVAIYEIGAFIGAVTTSFIGESLGRRKSILIGVIIMIVGKKHSLFGRSVQDSDKYRCPSASYCLPSRPHDCRKNRQWNWHGFHQLHSTSLAGRILTQGNPRQICLRTALNPELR